MGHSFIPALKQSTHFLIVPRTTGRPSACNCGFLPPLLSVSEDSRVAPVIWTKCFSDSHNPAAITQAVVGNPAAFCSYFGRGGGGYPGGLPITRVGIYCSGIRSVWWLKSFKSGFTYSYSTFRLFSLILCGPASKTVWKLCLEPGIAVWQLSGVRRRKDLVPHGSQ